MKMRNVAVIVAGLMLGMGTVASAAVYKVDVSHSTAGFKVKHMMISTVTGKFNEFSGTYDMDKGQFKTFAGTIKSASVNTGIEKRDDHLRSVDFFDAAKYPEITFTMTSATKDKMTGNLSIHGVTKKVTLDIEMGGTVEDNNGNMRSGFILTGKINRKDFGLNWNKAIEAGGVVVGEEVKLVVEIEGIEE